MRKYLINERENIRVQQLPLFNLLKPEGVDWPVRLSWSEGGRWLNTRVPINLHSQWSNTDWWYREWAYIFHLGVDRESSEMGLTIPSIKYIGCMKDSFARIPVPAVEEDFAGECWFTSWEIEARSFGCPLLYLGINSWFEEVNCISVRVQATQRLTGEMWNWPHMVGSRSYNVINCCMETREKKPGS